LDTNSAAFKQKMDLLIDRLARLSADSTWAHQASGIRGALLRLKHNIEPEDAGGRSEELEELVNQGYRILERAAGEIPDNSQT
jgi:hypothetical protein